MKNNWGYGMDKTIILEAYYRGLLSTEECTKILGIDPNILRKREFSTVEEFLLLESFTN